jgi:hypothetical protein
MAAAPSLGASSKTTTRCCISCARQQLGVSLAHRPRSLPLPAPLSNKPLAPPLAIALERVAKPEPVKLLGWL